MCVFSFFSKSYRLCRNIAFIERCSEDDSAVSFRVNWLKVLAQAMLGFTHFGLCWGEKCEGRADQKEMCTARDSKGWGIYTVPMPKERHGHHFQSMTSCFIVFLMFLVAPGLKRLPAFNKDGHPWHVTAVHHAHGFLAITHCADNALLDVWYRCVKSQTELLGRYLVQQHRLRQPISRIEVVPARAWQEKVKKTSVDVRAPLP